MSKLWDKRHSFCLSRFSGYKTNKIELDERFLEKDFPEAFYTHFPFYMLGRTGFSGTWGKLKQYVLYNLTLPLFTFIIKDDIHLQWSSPNNDT
jgi:hypothetical protein